MLKTKLMICSGLAVVLFSGQCVWAADGARLQNRGEYITCNSGANKYQCCEVRSYAYAVKQRVEYDNHDGNNIDAVGPLYWLSPGSKSYCPAGTRPSTKCVSPNNNSGATPTVFGVADGISGDDQDGDRVAGVGYKATATPANCDAATPNG